jgi:hypothetical protein
MHFDFIFTGLHSDADTWTYIMRSLYNVHEINAHRADHVTP